MASSTPYTVRWGIMATGWIAEMFTKDLLTNPATRDVHDVRHEVVAAASSSAKDRAASFLTKVGAPSTAKAYGSYHELVADPDVDIVYVATPHSHHFQNAMLALDAGKNVLCEKALTVNASQARKLVDKAKEKNVFFMEAVWTRYFPISFKVRELLTSGAIGNVYRAIADLSFGKDAPEGKVDFDDSHRMVNIDLAGGALLDLGIYSLTWVFQALYHVQPEEEKEAPEVVAAMNKYHTGADETTSIILQFPKHKSQGIALTSLRVATDVDGHNSGGPAIRIQGSEGEIQVMGPAYCPLQYKVIKKNGGGKVEVVDCPIPKDPERNWGHGMFWEADECARCLRDGASAVDYILRASGETDNNQIHRSIGYVLLVLSFGEVAAGLSVGRLADIHDKIKLFTITILLNEAALLLTFLACLFNSYSLALLGGLFFGYGDTAIQTMINSLIGSMFGGRPELFSAYRFFQSIGLTYSALLTVFVPTGNPLLYIILIGGSMLTFHTLYNRYKPHDQDNTNVSYDKRPLLELKNL